MFSRRVFFTRVLPTTGVALLGGGFLARRSFAVSNMTAELMQRAVPIINRKEASELDELPAGGREQIRTFVDGACLDVYSFAEEVCSDSFSRRLTNSGDEAGRRELVYRSFSKHVIGEEELLGRVDAVAREIGAELDRNWQSCCRDLAQQWGLALSEQDPRATLSADQLTAVAEPLIRDNLRQAIAGSSSGAYRPSIADTALGLGTSAVLLWPVMAAAPYAGVPVFLTLAFKHVFDFLLGALRSREANVQAVVSERLAQLGNRVALEFEREARRRITKLQKWQYHSLEHAAREQSQRYVSWL